MRRLYLGIFIIFLGFLSGCARLDYASRMRDNSLGLIMNDERRIGIACSRNIESKFRVLEDSVREERLALIGRRLVQYSGRPFMNYKFKIIDSPEFNSVSLPDGYVYVFDGLYNLAETDERLAFVLAHEMAHLSRSHLIKTFYAQQDFFYINFSELIHLGDSLTTLLFGAGLGRENEIEADRLGMIYLYRAGYDPKISVSLLKDLSQLSGHMSEYSLFRTHPNIKYRIKQAEKFLGKYLMPVSERQLKQYYLGFMAIFDKEFKRPRVATIVDKSPAQKSGVKLTDLIISVNDADTQYKNAAFMNKEFDAFLDKAMEGGGNVSFLVDRDGSEIHIDVKPIWYYNDPEINLIINEIDKAERNKKKK